MIHNSPPSRLRAAVEADLSPVTPLGPAWRRSALVLPGGLLLMAGIHLAFGLRFDADQIGSAALWGLSALQIAAGLLVLGGALRESVPGDSLPRSALLAAFGGLGLWMFAVTWLTWLRSPTEVPAGSESLYRAWCMVWPLGLSLPLIALGIYLARQAFALRPYLVGALIGAGSGAIVDAGWRTYCEVSAPGHVLEAHATALVAATVAGALAGALFARRD